MIKVIGVRFRQAGKIYNFDPAELEIKKGDHVIVETARGVEYGYVVFGVKEEKGRRCGYAFKNCYKGGNTGGRPKGTGKY